MKDQLRKASSLGTVVLGVLAAAVASGCGSDASGKTETTEKTGTQAAAITARSINITGCQATGVFDIVSPDVIAFVAIDRSDLADTQMQLSTVDETGRETRTDQTAQEADSAMQSLLDTRTDNIDAAQTSTRQASQNTSQQNAATTANNNESSTTTTSRDSTATSTVDSNATHADNHDDSHQASSSDQANTSQSAANQASASNDSRSANSQNTASASAQSSISPTTSFGSGLTAEQAANLQNSATNSSSSVNDQKANSTSSQSATDQATASNSANNVANQTADSNHNATALASRDNQTVASQKSSNSASTTENGAANSTSASSDANNNHATSASNVQNRNESSHQRTTSLVFNDLSRLNSRHLVLNVQMTSNKVQNLLRIFQGISQNVSTLQDFPVTLTNCIVTIDQQTLIQQPTVIQTAINPAAILQPVIVERRR